MRGASIANARTETGKYKEEHHQLPSLAFVHETNDWTSQTEEMSMDAELGATFGGSVAGIALALEFDDYKRRIEDVGKCRYDAARFTIIDCGGRDPRDNTSMN